MNRLNVTLDGAEQNLALDEALLLQMEENPTCPETLRIWEPAKKHVVLGRSSRVDEEVRLESCRRASITVLRRCTGGAAILAGPGCLFYSVVLNRAQRTEIDGIPTIHNFVLGRLQTALSELLAGVTLAGISDLAIAGADGQAPRKFSGNSLRVRRGAVLYHGTILVDFPLDAITQVLPEPPRQPAYRAARPHSDFLTNLTLPVADVIAAIHDAFHVQEVVNEWPRADVQALVDTKYSRDDWNLRL